MKLQLPWPIASLPAIAITSLLTCGLAGKSADEDLFPTAAGMQWTYKGFVNGQPVAMTAKVISSEKVGESKTVVMRWTMNGSPTQDETYSVTRDKVVRVRSGKDGSSLIEPSFPIIEYPMALRKSWTWKGTIALGTTKVDGTADVRVVAREKIESPSGAFNAWRVDVKLVVSSGGQSQTILNSYWFAAGAGLVKQSTTFSVAGKETKIEATATEIKRPGSK